MSRNQLVFYLMAVLGIGVVLVGEVVSLSVASSMAPESYTVVYLIGVGTIIGGLGAISTVYYLSWLSETMDDDSE